jgi:hypothetical protein
MEHTPSVQPNYLIPEVLIIPAGVTEDLIDFSDDESTHLTRQITQHAQPAPWYNLTPAPQQPISTLSTVTSIAKARDADVYNGRLHRDSSRTINSHFSIDDFEYRNGYNNSSASFPLERDANSHYRKWNHLLAVYSRDKRASLCPGSESVRSSRAGTEFGLVESQAAAAAAVGSLSATEKDSILQEADQNALLQGMFMLGLFSVLNPGSESNED